MKNVVNFGIGDRLYNSISEECRNNIYNVGLTAADACNRTIVINIDEYTDGFCIDMFANDMHAYSWVFETLDECIALLTGMNAINEFNINMKEYI